MRTVLINRARKVFWDVCRKLVPSSLSTRTFKMPAAAGVVYENLCFPFFLRISLSFSLTILTRLTTVLPIYVRMSPFLNRRPKTQRGKRALGERAPKVVENTKTALFLRGGRTSELVTQAMKDLVSTRRNRSLKRTEGFPSVFRIYSVAL